MKDLDRIDAEELLDEFMDYLLENGIGDLRAGAPPHFEKFFEAHCAAFAGWEHGAEHGLEFTQLFTEYEALMDSKLGKFADAHDISVEDLFRVLKTAAEVGRCSKLRSCAGWKLRVT
jgi:hypothetical protein